MSTFDQPDSNPADASNDVLIAKCVRCYTDFAVSESEEDPYSVRLCPTCWRTAMRTQVIRMNRDYPRSA